MPFELNTHTDYGTMTTERVFKGDEIAAGLKQAAKTMADAARNGSPPPWDSITIELKWID